jgi:hypothetical protein
MQVSVTGNGRVVAQIIRNKGRRAAPAWRRTADEMAREWYNNARGLSTIQWASTKELRDRDHPYAQRHFRGRGKAARAGIPAAAGVVKMMNRARIPGRQMFMGLPAPSYFINRQTGLLFGSWNYTVQHGYNSVYIRLTNSAPYFRWLHSGTHKMIRRPLLKVSLAHARRRFPEFYLNAQRQIHGQYA